MDRNLELAEMVVNKEIDLEEAKQLTNDEDDLLEKIKLRKSMKYAMMSMVYWHKMKQLNTDINSQTCSMNAYKGWAKRYGQMSAKLLEKHQQIVNQELQDAYWRWGKDWITEDVEESLDQLEGESAWYLSESQQYSEYKKQKQYQIDAKKTLIDQYSNQVVIYSIASFTQAIGEILETLADALLS